MRCRFRGPSRTIGAVIAGAAPLGDCPTGRRAAEPATSCSAPPLERLQCDAAARYANVPSTGRRSTPPACAPTTAASSPTWRSSPFTTKDDLRDNYPFGMFAVPQGEVRRIHASSGTTGTPDRRRLHRGRHRHLGRP